MITSLLILFISLIALGFCIHKIVIRKESYRILEKNIRRYASDLSSETKKYLADDDDIEGLADDEDIEGLASLASKDEVIITIRRDVEWP